MQTMSLWGVGLFEPYEHVGVVRLSGFGGFRFNAELKLVLDVQVEWDSEDGDDGSRREGPAARAVRTLEQQVAAAAEEATTGSIEEGLEEQLGH